MAGLHQQLMKQNGAYAYWHKQTPLYKFVHWAVFLFVAIFVTLGLLKALNKSVEHVTIQVNTGKAIEYTPSEPR